MVEGADIENKNGANIDKRQNGCELKMVVDNFPQISEPPLDNWKVAAGYWCN